jgi:hypothetical protein
VQLLRARDCPERHDYGLRYLHTDLRPAYAERVDALLPGVERLRELSAACFAWQDELLLSMGEPGERQRPSVVEPGERQRPSVVEPGERQRPSVVEPGERQRAGVETP